MGLGWKENSFLVSVDSQPEFHFEIGLLGDQWDWVWQRVYPDQQQAAPFSLSRGTHTIRFKSREDSARLDVVLLTANSAFEPTHRVPCEALAEQ
jgi:hypothetical protein